jgi:hypothetical protein
MDIMIWFFWQQELPVSHEVSYTGKSSIFIPNSIASALKIPIETLTTFLVCAFI